MANLSLCIGAEIKNAGYEFPMTRIRVYSFEEAQYHCFRYWRQSFSEFLAPVFLDWVGVELELAHIAQELRSIDIAAPLFSRLSAFLTIGGYFCENDLVQLKKEVALWESRTLWEKYKERGDFWAAEGDFERALVLYQQGLEHDENVALLNNAGVALLHLRDYSQAAKYFRRALAIGEAHLQMRLRLIEALVIGGDHHAAAQEINQALQENPENPEVLYFMAEMELQNKNYSMAITTLNRACDINYEPQFKYRLADCFVKIRQYDKALAALEQIRVKDSEFLRRQATILAASNNLPQAIKSIEKALVANSGDAGLWVLMAQYYRQDYDLTRADGAITKAISLAPDNHHALLELARIRKAQGYTRDYQAILTRVLASFKSNYREIIELMTNGA